MRSARDVWMEAVRDTMTQRRITTLKVEDVPEKEWYDLYYAGWTCTAAIDIIRKQQRRRSQ